MKFAILIACLIFLMGTGCSHRSSQKTALNKKQTFKRKRVKTIREKLREEALARYRRLRLQGYKTRRSGEIRLKKKLLQTRQARKRSKVLIRRLPKKPAMAKPPAKILTNPEELKIEVSQNLAYYCMSKRKQFSKESDCREVTKNALNKCEGQFGWDDRGLLRCVKSRLKF